MNIQHFFELLPKIFVIGILFLIFGSILFWFLYSIMSAGTITEADFTDVSRAPDILSKIRTKLKNGKALSEIEHQWLQFAFKKGLVEQIDGKYEPGPLMRQMLAQE